MKDQVTINIGIIGCGHWGPNHIRIFSHLPSSKALMCADLSQDRLQRIKDTFLNIETTRNYRDILNRQDIQAVCIASPTDTHYSIAKEALEHDKHVLCEKPLALDPQQCKELHEFAQLKKKVLMVGHVFLFNAGINKLKEYVESGELGNIYYAHATRTNLGPFRYDVNALWDLAPHDISIFNYLFGSKPINVSARGQKCLGNSHEDLGFVTLEYPCNVMANIHVSWLDPKKVRQITIVGDKKMAAWDDLESEGPIRLYDKHVEKTETFYETYGEFQLLSKEGSITIPNVGFSEPLKAQNQFFIDCIQKKESPGRCDAEKAYDVVRTLQAIQESMNQQGACISLE